MAYHVISITEKGWSDRYLNVDTDTAEDADADWAVGFYMQSVKVPWPKASVNPGQEKERKP